MSASTINVGVELEFPKRSPSRAPMRDAAVKSNDTRMYLRDEGFRLQGGNIVYDGTVGLEAVSDILPIEHATRWYKETVRKIENWGNCEYEPVSLIDEGPTSTAGTHIHISPMNRSEAEELFALSQKADVQLLTCSRVVRSEEPNYPVFRNDYCEMEFDRDRYSVINDRGNRWEWRLPEPQSLRHVENLFRFIEIFKQDGAEQALDYAKEKVEAGDTTSMQRVREIGTTEIPEVEEKEMEVDRAPGAGNESFFDRVFHDREAPYIYHVVDENEGSEYYAFWSNDTEEYTIPHEGVDFRLSDGQVRDAKSLNRVSDVETCISIVEAVNRYRLTGGQELTHTKAKDRLKELL